MSLDLKTLISVIYNQDAPDELIEHLKANSVENAANHYGVMRRVIGLIDRQRLPTPMIVRFDADDLVYADLGEFHLAVDAADASVGLSILHSLSYEPHVTAFMRRALKPA